MKRSLIRALAALTAGALSCRDATSSLPTGQGSTYFTYDGAMSGTFIATHFPTATRDDGTVTFRATVYREIPKKSDVIEVRIGRTTVGSDSVRFVGATSLTSGSLILGVGGIGVANLYDCFFESGVATISEISETRLKGSFNASCKSVDTTKGKVTITNGVFDVPYNPTPVSNLLPLDTRAARQ